MPASFEFALSVTASDSFVLPLVYTFDKIRNEFLKSDVVVENKPYTRPRSAHNLAAIDYLLSFSWKLCHGS